MKPLHTHFIGISGTGLSAIARVMLERGLPVSGCDQQVGPLAAALADAGVPVFAGHNPAHLQNVDQVVRSSAIPDDNPEVKAALTAGIPVYKRADFLGQLLAGYRTLAVAGAHGKTTTTAMLAYVLRELNLDPAFIIGGTSASLGVNAHAGTGSDFVIEADEYDYMFLGLSPTLAIVTNIEHDHPDCFPSPEDFYAAFEKFADRIVPGGNLVYCADDPGALRLGRAVAAQSRQVHAYGLASDKLLDYAAGAIQAGAKRQSFQLLRRGQPLGSVYLSIPGLHNVRNALAVLAAVDILGLDVHRAAQILSGFSGAGRRFELRGEAGGVAIIDDYAHHPTEIRATLQAARQAYPAGRIIAVWQPHTYSRARRLLENFAHAFTDADLVYITDIYPAREAPPADGFSSVQVAAAVQHPAVAHSGSLEQTTRTILERLQPGDVLIVLSAGDANRISAAALAELENIRRNPHGRE